MSKIRGLCAIAKRCCKQFAVWGCWESDSEALLQAVRLKLGGWERSLFGNVGNAITFGDVGRAIAVWGCGVR
ncbi:hypothetical protein [Dolichospermum sp. UHCC 0259]|uniref:hypothetical protein n=1 Tax=Dolichospermum sp. UHCC 0259 TaxID=2590010 RepID=UPI0014466C08|nr:hypothetical protein [Dolichospermum sp. UHCC 0259]MTJ50719.1 hypothetical protein [Dolichospermum sp. UHCC 0259]